LIYIKPRRNKIKSGLTGKKRVRRNAPEPQQRNKPERLHSGGCNATDRIKLMAIILARNK
jgi:hypothetical protein